MFPAIFQLPPVYTGTCEIPDNLIFTQGKPKKTLRDAFDHVYQAVMEKGKFPGYQLFGFNKDGFALVTATETIEADGARLEGDLAWKGNPPEFRSATVSGVFAGLLRQLAKYAGAKELHYRVIVLIVTGQNIVPARGSGFIIDRLKQSSVLRSQRPDNVELPDRELPAAHCYAYIFHFRKRRMEKETLVGSAESPEPRIHLEKAKLWLRNMTH